MGQVSLAVASRRATWPVLVFATLVLGAVLRVFAAHSPIGDLSTLLPWLNRPTATVYFTDPEGRYLVPVTRPVPASEGLPRAVLEELIRGPRAEAGLRRTVPEDTEVRGLEVQEGVAYVDLSRAFLAGGSATSVVRVEGLSSNQAEGHIVQAVTAVEKTLTVLPGIEDVVLTVEGQPLEVTGTRPPRAGETIARLYFVYGDYLVPVEHSLAGESITPRQAVEVYLQGPPSDGSLAGLPAGTQLLDFEFNPDNGLAYANMTYTEDVRALAVAEPKKMRLLLTSIIFTLTEFPEVQAVMLDFQGHAQLGLGQCRDLLRTPQLRPAVLNDERMN